MPDAPHTTPPPSDGAGTLETDLLIIGATPAGLYAAACAGSRGLRTILVDALPEPGGQVSAFFPEKVLDNVAGLPAVRGRELVDALLAQAAGGNPHYLLGRDAVAVAEDPDAVEGTDVEKERAFNQAFRFMKNRISAFLALPMPSLDAVALTRRVQDIGHMEGASEGEANVVGFIRRRA